MCLSGGPSRAATTSSARHVTGRTAESRVGAVLPSLETPMCPSAPACDPPATSSAPVCFVFAAGTEMDEIASTLALARIAAAALHGAERLDLEAPSEADPLRRTVVIDAATEVG